MNVPTLTRDDARVVFANDVNCTGVFWDWDHARPMGELEAAYWRDHIWPFGCAVLREPVRPAVTVH